MSYRSPRSITSLVAVLVFSTMTLAPIGRGQSGQALPRSRKEGAANATSPKKSATFNPHDLSGIWLVEQKTAFALTPHYSSPPMTPWAQARYDAAKPGIGPRQQALGNDPILKCDPIGYPRVLLDHLYPLEFLKTSDRVLQFFDFFYAYRTIWTDGRALPKNPDPRFYGYSVGKWEGDTFVVRSMGFDDRTWLDWDAHPHSDDMRLEERYRRLDHDTITVTLTVTDPKAYTQPWVSETKTLKWSPKEIMREDVCAPSDEESFYQGIREPAANAPSK